MFCAAKYSDSRAVTQAIHKVRLVWPDGSTPAVVDVADHHAIRRIPDTVDERGFEASSCTAVFHR